MHASYYQVVLSAFVNKMDLLVTEGLPMSEIDRVVGQLQQACLMGKTQKRLDPTEGNIIFGSASGGWGFTLDTFAQVKDYSTTLT
jgi:hypothetical protein